MYNKTSMKRKQGCW